MLYNPLTGATNERTVESHARGSAESGQHLTEGNGVPGRVGSPWLGGNKVDFVANFCGTYSTYPSQMFDRRVETMNSLYVGLRAFEMSTAAKRKVVDKAGNLMFASDDAAKEACMVFFQYMPFSSRAAAVIQQVTDAHAKAKPNATEAERDADEPGRAAAAKRVASAVSYRRSALNDVNAPFDTRVFDAIRTDDMRNCVGAWHVGRVLDTKAARHDPYAGGPRDTSFSCMVDVGLSWRSALPYKKELKEVPSDYYEYEEEIDDPENPGKKKKIKRQRSVFGWTTTERGGQQSRKTLTNAAQPCLQSVLGAEFGRKASQEDYCGKGDGGGTQSAGEAEVQEEEPPPPPPAAAVPTPAPAAASAAAAPAAAASTGPRPFGAPQPAASVGARPLGKAPRARSKTPPKGRGAALAAARAAHGGRGHVVDAARAHGRLAHRRGRRRRGRRRARAGAGRHVCRGHQRWRRRRVQLGRRPRRAAPPRARGRRVHHQLRLRDHVRVVAHGGGARGAREPHPVVRLGPACPWTAHLPAHAALRRDLYSCSRVWERRGVRVRVCGRRGSPIVSQRSAWSPRGPK